MKQTAILFFLSLPFLLFQLNLDPALADTEYTVKKGDTLYTLALKHNTSVENLIKLNNLSSNNLQIGQKLIISSRAGEINGNKITYKVVSGDTLSEIADRYGMSSSDLVKANNLPNAKLSIGQEIVIPAGGESQNKSASTTPAEPATSGSNQRIVAHYLVKEGDSLFNIAKVFEVSVDSLKAANNLSGNNIKPGGILLIPSSGTPVNTGTGGINEVTYTVSKGDTLSEIAEKFGTTTARIQLYNNISGSQLKIGQKIHIPAPGTVLAKNGSDNSPYSNSATDPKKQDLYSYEVASGDTLSQIAEKFGVSTASLKVTNNISSGMIRKGQKLLIPGKIDNKKDITTTVSSDTTRERNIIAPENQDLEDYTVRQGDTLSQIAERFGTSTDNLIFINDITGTQLIAGRTIRVPSSGSAEKTRSAGESFSYRIQKGDTLYYLARKYDTKVEHIKDINGLGSNNLRTGETIVIPGDGYVKSSTGPAGEPVVYKIRRGDTLGRIAQKFGVSVQSIRRANNINGNSIRAGSTLLIPSTGTRTIDYRVQKGDSLSYIARTHGSRVDLIRKANRLNSNSIYAGQILSIPVVRPGSVPEEYIAKSYKDSGNGMYDSNIKSNIINVAKKYLGAPYKFGGTSTRTGIDCSAYVNKVFKSFNVQLPRTARDIYKEGEWVEKDNLQKGDLVFFTTYAKFPSHVGIYMGNNKFIHASSASKKVTITDITRRYYKKRYIGAKRIPVEGLFYEQYSKEFDDTGNNYN